VVACAALPLLVPRLADRLPARDVPRLRTRDWRVAGALVVLAAVPFVVVAALPAAGTPSIVFDPDRHALAPVDESLRAGATVNARRVSLTWPPTKSSHADVYYNVYRSRANGSGGLHCTTGSGAANCVLRMKHVGSIAERAYADKPPPGRWTYRVAAAANSGDQPTGTDVLLVSPPTNVSVP
jgi:hypothetical protein